MKMSNISPDYYSKSNMQLSAFIRQNGLDFATGNAIKYIIRHKAKNGKQDILKAMWYLSDILEEDYGSELAKSIKQQVTAMEDTEATKSDGSHRSKTIEEIVRGETGS